MISQALAWYAAILVSSCIICVNTCAERHMAAQKLNEMSVLRGNTCVIWLLCRRVQWPFESSCDAFSLKNCIWVPYYALITSDKLYSASFASLIAVLSRDALVGIRCLPGVNNLRRELWDSEISHLPYYSIVWSLAYHLLITCPSAANKVAGVSGLHDTQIISR